MPNKLKTRIGFTLVELLVVIGIIGLLTALLLPAVQRVRDAARRTACMNNVRQLGLGLLNFESAHRQLPIGLRSFDSIAGATPGANFEGMTWITLILPYIDQAPLWNQAVQDFNGLDPFLFHQGMQTPLATVSCPSDPVTSTPQWTHENLLVACTDYLGVNGTDFKARNGVFTFDRPLRLTEINDGQSSTLMIGERPPSADFWYGWWYGTGAGSVSTGDVTLGMAELNPSAISGGAARFLESCPPGPYQFEIGKNEQCDALHFWSYHSGGAVFATADGATHFLNYSIAADVSVALATRDGGETIGTNF